jgi:D-alanine-D-alanine ligase-like ATP-grasp enzyme
VSEKLLEMRHFRVLLYPEEPESAPSWAAGVVRDEVNERNSSKRGGWVYNGDLPVSQKGNPRLELDEKSGLVPNVNRAVRFVVASYLRRRHSASDLDPRFKGMEAEMNYELWRRAAARLGFHISECGPLLTVENKHSGKRLILMDFSPSSESLVAYRICGNKPLTCRLLRDAQVAVPVGMSFPSYRWAAAGDYALALGKPCVVKPAKNTGAGIGVSVELRSLKKIHRALRLASLFCDEVLVEEFIPGDDYRCLVYRGKCLSVLRREIASVTGNGKSTVRELLERENQTRINLDRAWSSAQRMLAPLATGVQASKCLARQNLDWASVPEEDRVVRLAALANFQHGTSYSELLDETNPTLIEAVERAARAVGATLAGVDLISPDIRLPGYCVHEVNTTPGLSVHYSVDRNCQDPMVAILRSELC